MSVTINLKKAVDLPVWEWCRFNPNATTALSCTASSYYPNSRYMYFMISAALWRYDTWTDGWQQLASAFTALVTTGALAYKGFSGYMAKALSATSTTMSGPFLSGNTAAGYKIRISSGTGNGQEKTIVSVSDPVIMDTFLATGTGTTYITDSTKTWTINQWVGYQLRITYGTGASQIRRIRYNTANTLYVADPNWSAVDSSDWGYYFAVTPSSTAGAQSMGVIEYNTITVDTPWSVVPDSTTEFTILSGSLWALTAVATSPFYNIQRYDVLSDTWSYKTSMTQQFLAALGTDWSIDRMGEWVGNFDSGTATSGTFRSLTCSGKTWPVDRWQNYKVKITAGTCMGQERTISGNTATTLRFVKDFDAALTSSSVFEILADTDKIFFTGNGASKMLQYSLAADMMYQGKMFDYGTSNTMVAIHSSYGNFGVSGITRSGTTATVTTIISHPFKVGSPVTIKGTTGADASLYNIATTVTAVTSTTTFTYTMAGTPSANATTTNALSTTVLCDPTKNWIPGEHVGKLMTSTTPGPTGTCQVRKITANDATSLTFVTGTALVAGTSRYLIHDIRVFGTDKQYWDDARTGEGYATSGSTTTLVDSANNWPTNVWAANKLRIIEGTGLGAEIIITSNNATTLTYPTQTFTPDDTTRYIITSTFGTATSGSTTTLVDTTSNWPVNFWAGKRVLYTSGTAQGTEYTIASNTANTLTFATGTAPDATTTYAILSIAPRSTGTQMIWCPNKDSTNPLVKGRYIYSFRGGATNGLDRFDITTERWQWLSYSPQAETFTTGTMYAYDGDERIYITKESTGRVYYYDLEKNKIELSGVIPYSMSTALLGNRMEIIETEDGLKYLYILRHSAQEMWRTLLWW